MEGSSHIEEKGLGPLKLRFYSPVEPSPPLILLPSGESDPELYEALAEKLYLERFTAVLFPWATSWEAVKEAFIALRNLLRQKGRLSSLWIWGEGQGALWALRLSQSFSSEVSGLILDSFRWSDREEIMSLLRELRKPHLILHPQRDPSFPFTEAERIFILSPAHAKKLLLMPGMNRGETLRKGGDLYVQTLTEFINPRIGRWWRERKTRH